MGFRALRILVGFIPAEDQKPGAAAQRSPRRGIFVYLETVQGTPKLSYRARTASTSSAVMGFMSSKV